MTYKQLYASPTGRHIVINPETGERFERCPDEDWQLGLLMWQRSRASFQLLLDRCLRRATKRNSWQLYAMAKRGAYARMLPCPMPWGHVMFNCCKKPRKKKGRVMPKYKVEYNAEQMESVLEPCAGC